MQSVLSPRAGFTAVPSSDNDHPGIELAGYGSDSDSISSSSTAAGLGGAEGGGGPASSSTSTRQLTRLNGLALVISLQIGSGIFTVPSQVAQFVSGPGWALGAWLMGGLLVWTGAASFVELGLRMPCNGGVQEYLHACYGAWAGFLFSFLWVVVAKPAANAIIAQIAAGYIGDAAGVVLSAVGILELSDDAPSSGEGAGAMITWWVAKGLALSCVVAITLVNCLTTTSGARAANMFLFLKLAALGAIVLIGAVVWALGTGGGVAVAPNGWGDALPPPAGPGGAAAAAAAASTWRWVGDFGTALFGALFCYGGWETAGFVLGDMRNPEADLPVVIHGAMATVITGFVLLNAALFVVLPMDVIRESTTVAVEFARHTLGEWGALLFSLVVAVSAMGALNANVFATAKICVNASRRGYFPAVLANLHVAGAKDEAGYLDRALSSRPMPAAVRGAVSRFAAWTLARRWHHSVPVLALIANSTMTCIYVMAGSLNGLVTLIGLTEFLLFMLAVVGLLRLRRGEFKQQKRAALATQSGAGGASIAVPSGPASGEAPLKHKTWILNPLIFSAVSCLLILRGVLSDPWQGVAITAVSCVGLGLFVLRFGLRGFWIRPATGSGVE